MRFSGVILGLVAAGLAGAVWADQRIVQAPHGVGNLRAEAGWWADVAGLAPNGSEVKVLARSGSWVWVQQKGGAVGWIEAKQLAAPVAKVEPVVKVAERMQVTSVIGLVPIKAKAETPAVATPPDTPAGKYLSVVYTEQGKLNLRDGPGTRYAVVSEMTRGSWVEVQEKAGDWARLKHESGAEGWAYRKYLTR